MDEPYVDLFFQFMMMLSMLSNLQLHCLEKNGRQTTKMVSYCAYHRYRVLICFLEANHNSFTSLHLEFTYVLMSVG